MNAIEDRRVSLGMRQATLSGMQSPILEAMISVGLFMALMSGGYFIANGSISTGDFAAFLLALTAAYRSHLGRVPHHQTDHHDDCRSVMNNLDNSIHW